MDTTTITEVACLASVAVAWGVCIWQTVRLRKRERYVSFLHKILREADRSGGRIRLVGNSVILIVVNEIATTPAESRNDGGKPKATACDKQEVAE